MNMGMTVTWVVNGEINKLDWKNNGESWTVLALGDGGPTFKSLALCGPKLPFKIMALPLPPQKS